MPHVLLVLFGLTLWAPDARASDESASGEMGVTALGFSMGGPQLGVTATELTSDLRVHFGVPEDRGVLISSVMPGSSAERAGLRVGDVLTALAGHRIQHTLALRATLAQTPGGEVTVDLVRDGRRRSLAVMLDDFERPSWEETRRRYQIEGAFGRASELLVDPVSRTDLDPLYQRLEDLELALLEMTDRIERASERVESRLERLD